MIARIGRLVAMVTALCLLAGCASGGREAPSTTVTKTYDRFTQSYTVPWLDSPDFSDLRRTLKIQASVNGGKVSSYTVDTGSVGLVVPASEVPNIPPGSPPGSLTYSSSGLKLTGVWATLPISFPQAVNARGANVAAQAIVPVLAVTEASCTGSGVNSSRCRNHIPHMLGVGFGRGKTERTAPDHNPFLNLTEMVAGTMRRGYIIGRGGLVLGLTDSNTVGAWTMQPLKDAGEPASGTHHDWTPLTGGFTVGSDVRHEGTVLIDTGLLNMIVEDDGLPSGGEVPAGTDMSITLGGVNYRFRVGDGGAQTPSRVNYARASRGAFVNTGLRALGRYDLLFDADGGFLGLHAR
ncbi:hypothetical protein H7J50_25735 [Mycobacterium intermedium]|uniref:hypothetical protein n=1 Tax=Mycobacterium intermedium TaxID=28445 RepID=UPI00111C3FD8|nr:hypothetical protein [Mycobacterium intermedium]MCV6967175.1 hypothetical protein [Mycobacterium intermedium]